MKRRASHGLYICECTPLSAAFFVSVFIVLALAFSVLFASLPSPVQAQTPGCAPLENTVESFSRNQQFDQALLLSNGQSVTYFEASYTGVDPDMRVLLVRHIGGTWAALRVFGDEVCLPPLPLQPQVHQRGMAAVYGNPA